MNIEQRKVSKYLVQIITIQFYIVHTHSIENADTACFFSKKRKKALSRGRKMYREQSYTEKYYLKFFFCLFPIPNPFILSTSKKKVSISSEIIVRLIFLEQNTKQTSTIYFKIRREIICKGGAYYL